jgi:hypothetical protein
MHACMHAQLTLKGADQLFGLVTFWAAVNRKVEIRVVRMGEPATRPSFAACDTCVTVKGGMLHHMWLSWS